jgi:hypothetical protein
MDRPCVARSETVLQPLAQFRLVRQSTRRAPLEYRAHFSPSPGTELKCRSPVARHHRDGRDRRRDLEQGARGRLQRLARGATRGLLAAAQYARHRRQYADYRRRRPGATVFLLG